MVSFIRRRFLFLIPLVLFAAAAPPCMARAREVLMIGNSYTLYNDLNLLLQSIARSAGEEINVSREAVNGYTLKDHWKRCQTQRKLNSRHWDLVILQEHSLISGNAALRKNVMRPAVDRFYKKLAPRKTQIMLLMTWGRKKSIDTTFLDEKIRFRDYATMQEAVRQGYEEVGRTYHLPVAPVGIAWQTMRQKYPDVTLYHHDNSHPMPDASYLAALTVYGAIYGRSPADVRWRPDNMPRSTARKLREAAALAFPKTISIPAVSGTPGGKVKVSVLASGLAACREWGFSLEYDPSRVAILGVRRGRSTAAWPAPALGSFGGLTRISARLGTAGTPLTGNKLELCTLIVKLTSGTSPVSLTPRFTTEGAAYCLVDPAAARQVMRSAAGSWTAYE
jgi:hypothetical protein